MPAGCARMPLHMASAAWSPSEDDPPGARVVFARPWGGVTQKSTLKSGLLIKAEQSFIIHFPI